MLFTMSVYLPIRTIQPGDDGTIIVEADAIATETDADMLREAVSAFGRDDIVFREMGHGAAGLVKSIVLGAGNVFKIVARVIDPTAILKVNHRVLRGLTVTPRFVNLVDVPGGFEKLALWKAATDMTDQNLSPFQKAFRTAFAKASGGGAEDGRAMNEVDPNHLDDATDDMPALTAALAGLHRANPPPPPSPLLERFGVGVSGANFYDLADRATRPTARPARDIFLERLLAAGGAELPGQEKLKPPPSIQTPEARNMLKSNGAPSEAMRKAQSGLAAPYRENRLYDMLVSNSPGAPSKDTMRKAAPCAPSYADETAAFLRSNSAPR